MKLFSTVMQLCHAVINCLWLLTLTICGYTFPKKISVGSRMIIKPNSEFRQHCKGNSMIQQVKDWQIFEHIKLDYPSADTHTLNF